MLTPQETAETIKEQVQRVQRSIEGELDRHTIEHALKVLSDMAVHLAAVTQPLLQDQAQTQNTASHEASAGAKSQRGAARATRDRK